MNEKEIIKLIVYKFYEKATADFLIGHHFRKIQEFTGDNVLVPPMAAFSHHLPRINQFWEMQLLGKPDTPLEKPFNLIMAHEYLHIRVGEVGRWVTLFKETIAQVRKDHTGFDELFDEWLSRIDVFNDIFLRSKIVRSNQS